MTAQYLSRASALEELRQKRILITGATGWLGRETINRLHALMNDTFIRNVTLASSTNCSIMLRGRKYGVSQLSEIHEKQKFDLVIHLAFITQDRMLVIGKDEYIRINRSISDSVLDLCTRCEVEQIFLASSGVVDPHVINRLNSDSKHTYAELKSESEESFRSLANRAGIALEIGRIWTVSGEFIQDPSKYAIGNFIIQARKLGVIKLVTASEVLRTYINAGELMEVYLLNLMSGQTDILDSGGFESSIRDLARLVIEEICPTGRVDLSDSSEISTSDIYLPNSSPFNSIAEEYGIKLSTIAEQIRTTARAATLNF